jgi:hypothetical protein
LLPTRHSDNPVPDIAEEAYVVSDAMLVARKIADKNPDNCAPSLDHGQSPDRGEGP